MFVIIEVVTRQVYMPIYTCNFLCDLFKSVDGRKRANGYECSDVCAWVLTRHNKENLNVVTLVSTMAAYRNHACRL